jgi:transposase-like protein
MSQAIFGALFMTSPLPAARKGKIVCPQCSDTAHRVQRTWGDRIVSLIKPVKRYRCDFCDWTGTLSLVDARDKVSGLQR